MQQTKPKWEWGPVLVLCSCLGPANTFDAGVFVVDAGAPADAGRSDAGTASLRTVVLAIDTSASTSVSDWSGQRSPAFTEFVNQLPDDWRLLVVTYAGDSATTLTTFRRVGDLTSAERVDLATQAGATSTNVSATNHVSVLQGLAALIAHDGPAFSARYDVVFETDLLGSSEENELMCGDTVSSLLAAVPSTSTVVLSTVQLNQTASPHCTDPISTQTCSVTAPPSCTLALLDASAARLQKVADRGHGLFTRFGSGATVHYTLPP